MTGEISHTRLGAVPSLGLPLPATTLGGPGELERPLRCKPRSVLQAWSEGLPVLRAHSDGRQLHPLKTSRWGGWARVCGAVEQRPREAAPGILEGHSSGCHRHTCSPPPRPPSGRPPPGHQPWMWGVGLPSGRLKAGEEGRCGFESCPLLKSYLGCGQRHQGLHLPWGLACLPHTPQVNVHPWAWVERAQMGSVVDRQVSSQVLQGRVQAMQGTQHPCRSFMGWGQSERVESSVNRGHCVLPWGVGSDL